MHHFMVSYNNSFSILHDRPMRCSASGMFASSGVNSCIRRSVYSLQCRLHASLNSIVYNIINRDLHLTCHYTNHDYVHCIAKPCICKRTSSVVFKTIIMNSITMWTHGIHVCISIV